MDFMGLCNNFTLQTAGMTFLLKRNKYLNRYKDSNLYPAFKFIKSIGSI